MANPRLLTIKGPDNQNQDIRLTSKVAITENDADSGVAQDIAASQVMEQTLSVNFQATTEEENTLQFTNNGKEIDTLISNGGGNIQLNKFDINLIQVQQDLASNDEITQLILTLSEADPRIDISGATRISAYSWLIDDPENLSKLSIKAPNNYNKTVTVTIGARVVDKGVIADDQVNDISAPIYISKELSLDFEGNRDEANGDGNSGHAHDPAIISIADFDIQAQEDGVIPLGSQIEENLTLSETESRGSNKDDTRDDDDDDARDDEDNARDDDDDDEDDARDDDDDDDEDDDRDDDDDDQRDNNRRNSKDRDDNDIEESEEGSSRDASAHSNDMLTIAINADSVPDGVELQGFTYDFVLDEYVSYVSIDAGVPDLSALTALLPRNFSGELELDMRFATSDTVSGGVYHLPPLDVNNALTYQAQHIDITPVVDGIVSMDLSADSANVSIGGAYENTPLDLDLATVFSDKSIDITAGGVESLSGEISLRVDANQGVFVDLHNQELGSEIIISADEIDQYRLKPAIDLSGRINIDISGNVVDSTTINNAIVTDTQAFTVTTSIDVIAVNSEMTWDIPQTPLLGSEDQPLALIGIAGSLSDIDGSEQILSVQLTGVPNGFTILGAANNGGGVWTIKVPANQESFDLSSVQVQPAKNFNGEVEIGITVFSKEDSLLEPKEHNSSIQLNYVPIADGVQFDLSADKGTINLAGTEGDIIELPVDAELLESSEQMQVTLTGLPADDVIRIELPENADGEVKYDAYTNSWIVTTVAGVSVSSLLLYTQDTNSENTSYKHIHFDIRAVDNGVVASGNLAINKDISLTLEAVHHDEINLIAGENEYNAPTGSVPLSDLHLHITDTSLSQDVQNIYVKIENLPSGAQVVNSGVPLTVEEDGSYTVNAGDLANAYIQGLTQDIRLDVTAHGSLLGEDEASLTSHISVHVSQNLIATGSGTLSGGVGDDSLLASDQGNTLVGNLGNDILIGGEGADLLLGGLGADNLTGHSGHDTFSWSEEDFSSDHLDTVMDFELGFDHLDFGELFHTEDEDELSALLNEYMTANFDPDDGRLHLTVSSVDKSAEQEVVFDNLTPTSFGEGSLTLSSSSMDIITQLMESHSFADTY